MVSCGAPKKDVVVTVGVGHAYQGEARNFFAQFKSENLTNRPGSPIFRCKGCSDPRGKIYNREGQETQSHCLPSMPFMQDLSNPRPHYVHRSLLVLGRGS